MWQLKFKIITSRNRKHRRAIAKPAACTESLRLSTVRGEGGRNGREVGKEVGRDGGRREG